MSELKAQTAAMLEKAAELSGTHGSVGINADRKEYEIITTRERILALIPTDYAAALEEHDKDQRDIGMQTAEALLQSYLSGGPPTFVHELTEPMLNTYVARRAAAQALDGKCHERAELISAGLSPVFRACVLPKGHTGEHRGGGNCFRHGEYVGNQCPQWPDCISNFAAQAPEEAKRIREAEMMTVVRIMLEEKAGRPKCCYGRFSRTCGDDCR